MLLERQTIELRTDIRIAYVPYELVHFLVLFNETRPMEEITLICCIQKNQYHDPCYQ